MASPTLPDALLTGHERIDDQHRFLFALVADMAREGVGGEKLVALRTSTIASYAAVHFLEEEALMGASGYPDIEAHRQEHAALARWIEDFQAAHKAGRASFKDLLQRMQAWLTDHIQSCDARFVAFLRQDRA